MLDFINPEEFDYSWLPEEELQVPDSIMSEDLQTAINCFCDEVKEFLVSQCPQHEAQIKYALQHGRTFHTLFTMGHYCPKQLKDLAETIADWVGEVFYYQCIEGVYEGQDPSFDMDPDTKKMLRHPEIYDIPRRWAAMRRLRESWKSLPPKSGIQTVRDKCQIDMRGWDRDMAA
jgi:hypothetical protein